MIIKSFLVIGILLIMLCSLVSALTVSSLYGKSEANVLQMYPGESKDIILTVESSDEDGDLNLKAEIIEGSVIVSLINGPEYSLLAGENIVSNLRVEIPEDATLGTEYTMKVHYSKISEEAVEGGGSVILSLSTTKTINVLVIEKTTETPEGISTTWIILGIILIVAVIAVIYFISKSKKASVPAK